jgi:hypothetical protein
MTLLLSSWNVYSMEKLAAVAKSQNQRSTEALNLNVENASDENFDALERAVSTLGNVQWARMNENEKKVTFVPEQSGSGRWTSPTLWTRERYRSARKSARRLRFHTQATFEVD